MRCPRLAMCSSVLQCAAVCCSVLQCVAVCCSVMQCAAVCCSVCLAVCCSVLQCGAVCCSVVQCVAVCCSVLQCAASCCSVWQCAWTHEAPREADLFWYGIDRSLFVIIYRLLFVTYGSLLTYNYTVHMDIHNNTRCRALLVYMSFFF